MDKIKYLHVEVPISATVSRPKTHLPPEAGIWDFRIAIGFAKRLGVAGKILETVRLAVEPDHAIDSPTLAVGVVGSSCS